MTNLNGWKSACIVLFLFTAGVVASPAQTFTSLVSFDGKNGSLPGGSLVQGLDGNLYGTTQFRGPAKYAHGTVFKMTPTGSLTTLFSFCTGTRYCNDGAQPVAGLTLGVGGSFYGTTFAGGVNEHCCSGGGTVFRIDSKGEHVTLYSFCSQNNCTDGRVPYAGLVQGRAGNWYGTAAAGGTGNQGTVYKMTPNGVVTTIYSFCPQGGNCADGALPGSDLIFANDGSLYGTTEGGGAHLQGTIFKITPSGKLTTLYSFCSQTNCADGAQPARPLVLASDGNFYGTTPYGGANSVCDSGNCGTVFKLTPSGALTTLYSFCAQNNCADGNVPEAGLVQATDGNLYGTTALGGATNNGTIFRITPSGTVTTLYSFCPHSPCVDGVQPNADLLQATDGDLYGTTPFGGTIGAGTVFKLSVGLGPFVEALPYADAVGKTVKILGQGLTGTTAVSFNGVAATFTVQSDTYLTAVVPTGATSGLLRVTTPGGVLTSNKPFTVLP